MITMNGNAMDDGLALISELFPGIYSQLALPAQEAKQRRRRRRRRNRGEQSGITGMKKRKLSQDQVNMLEQKFGEEHKLKSERKDSLAVELELDPRQVAVWFQNRRARFKSKKLEEEYSRMKSAHDNTMIEKWHLETEVLKLKERLADAENENRRLYERLDNGGGSSNSPISSVTMMDQPMPWPGNYVYDDVFFPETSCIINGMPWVDPFM